MTKKLLPLNFDITKQFLYKSCVSTLWSLGTTYKKFNLSKHLQITQFELNKIRGRKKLVGTKSSLYTN